MAQNNRDSEEGVARSQLRPRIDIYGGRNPVGIAAYSIPEAAHHLRVPTATVRSWMLGRNYPTEKGPKRFSPAILIADAKEHALSFQNLVELHVLSSIRRVHQVRFREVRRAIDYLQKELRTDHRLWDQQMLTDGKDLFVQRYGQLVNSSQDGQLEMRRLMEIYLRRIERDEDGLPVKLFPFTSTKLEDSGRTVAIDPRIEFGRPCIAKTGTPTAIIAGRYAAGDSKKY